MFSGAAPAITFVFFIKCLHVWMPSVAAICSMFVFNAGTAERFYV